MKAILAINKPSGISSFGIIRQLKKQYPGEKIGHGGTLDPLATGVIVVAIGREYTRKLGTILNDAKKQYVAEIVLGVKSTTDDAAGKLTTVNTDFKPTEKDIKKALKGFTGIIKQIPPQFSAVKINGKPAYKRVLRGEKINLRPKTVEIKEIELLEYNYPIIKIKTTTGSGVYIRSLARDLGEELKVGGYIKSLIRTRVGKYTIDNATIIESDSI